tara:strand:+ start:192 stop:464 length:273 start_codon:yes stop_codon:yes gene_type:complete
MNRDELVGYIQGLIDMSKELNEMGVMAKRESEPKLLELINKALEKHRFSQIKGGGHFFYNAEHYENLCHSPSEKDNNKGNWCNPNPTDEK